MTAASAATIEVDRVTKWFGDLVALSDVSFEVGPGVTALLGPNGAGKSTMLRVLCGLTAPSRGGVRVLGTSPRGKVDLYRQIGLVPQQEVVFEGMTAHDFVSVSAELAGLRRGAAAAQAASNALGLVELDPADRRPINAYSKGMRQRVKMAAALVHEPEVVVLDEPLVGLDPRQRLRMIEVFRRLGAEGRTVLVSSHVLDEVEKFGSRVLVMVQGKLAAEGDFRAIRDLMDDRPHRVRVACSEPRAVAAGLVESGAALGVRVAGEGVVVDTDQVGALRRALPAVARDRGAHLFEVVPLDDDLESVFRYLVERR
jgi:ABC-2 type transport system ATP-binding protein